jgi:hypothetical protein
VPWREDAQAVAQFTARYLNVVRLDEAGVRRAAEGRLEGGDVAVSACTYCPVREPCHATFGAVGFGETAIGLFPLSPVAPQRLLAALDERPGLALARLEAEALVRERLRQTRFRDRRPHLYRELAETAVQP